MIPTGRLDPFLPGQIDKPVPAIQAHFAVEFE